MKTITYVSIGVIIFILGSCKKLIEIGPPENQITTSQVFDDSVSAMAAVANAYAVFEKTIDPVFNKTLGLYTDELYYPSNVSTDLVEFSQSRISPVNSFNLNLWKTQYFAIYQCNSLLENVKSGGPLPGSMVESIQAEARFLRGFTYFNLVNEFGSVPLVINTDVQVNAVANRKDEATILVQVLEDLQFAENHLSPGYRGPGKVRANKWAATALLSRVYLYQKNWAMAEAKASEIINSNQYTPLESPSNVFLANSKETILQCWTQFGFVNDVPSLVPASGVPNYPLTDNFLSTFEAGDLRKSAWTNSTTVTGPSGSTTYYYPYKYKNRTNNTSNPEYLMLLRIAEQYLVRAEARAQLNNLAGAMADLNVIRSRANLANTTANTQSGLLSAIGKEKRIELFMEWGNRFFELKRTQQLNAVMSAYKSTWRKDTATVLPVPQNEITYQPALNQNPGY